MPALDEDSPCWVTFRKMERCFEDNRLRWKIFSGPCNDLRDALDVCMKKEYDDAVKANWVKTREQGKRFAALTKQQEEQEEVEYQRYKLERLAQRQTEPGMTLPESEPRRVTEGADKWPAPDPTAAEE
ncbi:MAG: hypothetical protein BJ554DRAFT_2453 [Olpidium bornovanus]|uniref:COX assembly mitochondrial protein n=1 Tax=Olpidium bornovanus TaxID=278681 RepID=A0A8H8DGY4_9FUNG|nr:MAG: hypothetical protein BJ554DRAFT_2453 [Olpidium bornovanus]